MIPIAYVTAWREHAPWSEDAQVEQDLVLSRALVEIYSDPLLSMKLAFRGGTALHKLFMRSSGRYSEDLDFVQVDAENIGPVLDRINGILNAFLGKPKFDRSENITTFTYRFETQISPVRNMKLKVEINTREHFSVYGFKKIPFAIDSPWIGNKTVEVTTYSLEELLGTKMRALYQRKKGRDLFDLWLLLNNNPDINFDKILSAFYKYMHFSESRSNARKKGADMIKNNKSIQAICEALEKNILLKLEDKAYVDDITPLLPNNTFPRSFPARFSSGFNMDDAANFLLGKIRGRIFEENGVILPLMVSILDETL